MNLCLSQSQRASLEQLSIAGGASSSLFPGVEAWLREPGRWDAIRALGKRKDVGRYWSVVDFLLVVACPSTLPDCLAYYEGSGLPLRALATRAECQYYERRMLALLELARAARACERRLTWAEAVEFVDLLEAA